MSNSEVFGSPMILTGRKPVSPFGGANHSMYSEAAAVKTGRRLLRALGGLITSTGRDRRIRNTVIELSKLDDRVLRDIGLARTEIMSVSRDVETRGTRRFRW